MLLILSYCKFNIFLIKIIEWASKEQNSEKENKDYAKAVCFSMELKPIKVFAHPVISIFQVI